MELSVQHDLKKLQKNLNKLGEKAFKPALNSALNKVGTKQTNASVKEVSEVQRVQQKKIKERLRITRSNFRTLTYRSTVNARGITWHSLNAKTIGRSNNTRGVRAGTGKYKHVHRHAFLARSGKSGNQQVFVREGSARYPLRVLRVRLYTPFNRAFRSRMKKAKTEFLTTLDKELIWRVNKELNKHA